MRLLAPALALIAGLALALAAGASGAPRQRRPTAGFTIKNFAFGVRNQRLAFTLNICTRSGATLRLQGTFTPLGSGPHVPQATPGSTQYQSRGCWPAQVSTMIVISPYHCRPIACPAIQGRRYRAQIKITSVRTHRSLRTPTRRATA